MHRVGRIVLVVVSVLLPGWVVAEDGLSSVAVTRQAKPVTASTPAYRQAAEFAPYWQRNAPDYDPVIASEALHPIEGLDFRDPGAFARVSKLRELSFLTLAELGKSRLFFGVNDDGLFGIHFCALPRPGGERTLELARMPYLKDPVQQRFAN